DVQAYWGIPVRLTGSATDPSAADTAAGFAGSWDFGDGSPPAQAFDVSHVYGEPDTYTATLTAADKDGGTGTDTATAALQRRPAALAYAGASGLDASSAHLAARLADAIDQRSARLDGHLVTIKLGPRSCTSTTDATGLAECTVDASALPLGPAAVTASF